MSAAGPIPQNNLRSPKEWLAFVLYPIAKSATIPLTQPLARIGAIQQQSAVHEKGAFSFFQAASDIFKKNGLKGFYFGTFASVLREGFKSTYKGILQVKSKDLADHHIPSTMIGSEALRALVAGTLVGVVDPLIAAPIEGYKTFVMTQPDKVTLGTYLKYLFTHAKQTTHPFREIISQLYRGTVVTMGKQSLMNSTFFAANSVANNVAKPHKKEYPKLSIILVSVFSGIGAALVGAPMDVVKSIKQQNIGNQKSAKALIKLVLEKSGYRGLLAGLGARFGLVTIGYATNGFFLNIIHEMREKEKSKYARPDSNMAALETALSSLSVEEGDLPEPGNTDNYLPQHQNSGSCPFVGEPLCREDKHKSNLKLKKYKQL